MCPSLASWQACQAYRLPTGSLRHKNKAGTKAVPCHFHFPFPQTHSTLSVTRIRTSSNFFAKKNCYLFCITIKRIACSQAFLLCPLSFLICAFFIRCCNQTQQVFLPRKIAGSRRVLATAVDNWLENLLALAPVQT